MSNAELVLGAAGLLATSSGAVAMQLWRLADRLARLEERLDRSLQCCDTVAAEVVELGKQTQEHRDALVRGGLL